MLTETAPTSIAPLSDVSEMAVVVSGLSKCFKIYSSPWHRVAEWLDFDRKSQHTDFWALRDINFTIPHGQALGIIGINGSGKSTLLKILTGALHATSGSCKVTGRVLSLLELGTGLNMLLTGRQNIINSSTLLGFPPDYATEKIGIIEEFAELGEFFDRPIRLYSTGMMVRLAFSMFVAFEPDVFVVDEALSVGDIFFQQKCARRIEQLRANGTTLLFVSHDLAAVESLCDNVLVLHHGKQEHFGDKIKGINLYYALSGSATPKAQAPPVLTQENVVIAVPDKVQEKHDADVPALKESDLIPLPWQAPDATGKTGDGSLELDAICIRRSDGQFVPLIEQGRDVEIFARFVASSDAGPINIGISLYDRFDKLVYSQSWLNVGLEPVSVKAGETIYASFRLHMDIEPGVECAVAIGASVALPDPQSPTGWNQSAGGTHHVLLPRAAILKVLLPEDRLRRWFGPANLQAIQRRIIC